MAMGIKVSTDTAKLSRQLEDRLLKRGPRAAVAGINRVARGAFTLSVREIQADIGASSQKSIRRNLTVKSANVTQQEALITASSSKNQRIPIYEINPRPRNVTKRRPSGGVRYGPRNKLIPGSFIAKLQSGRIGVFTRVDAARLPIEEKFGPSVALVFSRKIILDKVKAYVSERLPGEIARAFKFATG